MKKPPPRRRPPKSAPPAHSIVLTVPEAADVLRVSRGTIYNLAAAKDLDLVKFGTAARITRASIDRLVAQAELKAGG